MGQFQGSETGGGAPTEKEVLSALREKLAALDQHIVEVVRRKQRITALIEKYT